MKKEKVIRIILVLIIAMLLLTCFRLSIYNNIKENNEYLTNVVLVEDDDVNGCRPLNGK